MVSFRLGDSWERGSEVRLEAQRVLVEKTDERDLIFRDKHSNPTGIKCDALFYPISLSFHVAITNGKALMSGNFTEDSTLNNMLLKLASFWMNSF